MPPTLVDSNVWLDILTVDPVWFEWSSRAMESCAAAGRLCINPIIYAEISIRFTDIGDLETALAGTLLERLPLPFPAAFLAGKAFLAYRKRGGVRTATLPDFFIGAHAAVAGLRLLTRDGLRYRTYFPTVELIAP
jgi:hypothetical protein